jgi:MFS family permease
MNPSVLKRLTWLLFLGQGINSAGLIASVTVGAIVGEMLSGQRALAGLPGSVYFVGNALTAYPAARLMEWSGRRWGLTLGFVIGTIGGVTAGWAILGGSFSGFLVGYALMGCSRGFTDLARYAAAEMYPAAERGRAISQVVLAGTIGGLAGPNLVPIAGRLMESFHGEPLAGPWFVAALLFMLGAILIGLFLRPDPSELSRALAASAPDHETRSNERVRPARVILGQPATQVAIGALVIGQLVMVMLMSITSLHMAHHGHGLGDISIVIVAHTLGMFGLSIVAGRLADTFGRAPTIVAGAGILMGACLLAPLSQTTGLIALALFLLGLGWNFCYVAGAALLTDTLTVAERGRIQGASDLLIGLVSALGALGSGFVFATLGYTLMGAASLIAALIPLWMAWRLAQGQTRYETVAGD